MKKSSIKSFCKVNLFLKVIKKMANGYHSIESLITFCNLYDKILISQAKSQKDKIIFSGRFQKGINKKKNTISKLLNLLREKKILKGKYFKIIVQKEIPHGSGLGGGSSNAASLLKFLNFKMKLNLNKKKLKEIGGLIGFDVPVYLEKKNNLILLKKNKIIKMNRKLNINLLIVYPNQICSTKKIYNKFKIKNIKRSRFLPIPTNKKKMIYSLINSNNDLQNIVVKIYPKVKSVIKYIKSQKGCFFARITGSGSACIGIFSSKRNAVYAKKMIKLKYPKYWSIVAKTI